ncbi:copper amine oxidase N-terminal domain-containing protein [Paenibacillus hunanensis]|uniref:copper amine oxidase N-terminal domain-containing protein n=1 Tax=Paenibacillus hunanensis TaxID=539262 RepID=UPI002026C727|nr:copper amine oxidase N-terminal domain-containing protein [Paenibacillus hunanensis]MCL9663607.1 copper amine oxidase N-terminal domain-containing protein [Paenibacillus hunanensis]
MMKMKKLLVLMSLTSILAFGSTASAMNDADNIPRPIHVNVNGKFVQTDANPEQVNNRVLVPIRALSSLGLNYVWNSKTKSVSISNVNQNKIVVTLNSKKATMGDKTVTLDVPAQMRHDRVYVPVRFVTEAFGSKVQLETIRQILFVTSENNSNGKNNEVGTDLKSQRQAAISLPIQASFKLINLPNESYAGESYNFAEGKADEYIYSDARTATVVKIQNGKAIAVGQYIFGALADFEKVAGDIKDYSDPVFRSHGANATIFNWTTKGEVEVNYTDAKGNRAEVKEPNPKSYADVILAIPDNK